MRSPRLLPLASLLVASSGAFAQVAPPDGGQVLNTLRPVVPKAPASQQLQVAVPAEPAKGVSAGPAVVVSAVTFEGNTVFSAEVLRALIAAELGKKHDLEGLRALARIIGRYYRENGYPFARAVVPAQELKDGLLRIRILEGAYGEVRVTGEAAVAAGSQPYLSPLRRGELIESTRLERTLLILDDVPGVGVRPVVSPGQQVGVGDLEVGVLMEKEQGGEAGVDNEGSRYTGDLRFRAAWYRNSALQFGDRLAASVMATNASLWLGSVDYDAALGSAGLRGQVGWALNTYQLGKEFAALEASGLARVWTAKLSYPLIRSRQSNLLASFGLQYKSLNDDFDATSVSEDKFSRSLPLSLRFDHRDGLGGGGITYGMLTWTHGDMNLDAGLTAVDDTTARKQGHFDKVTLDLARVQNLPAGFSLYGRYSLQLTDRNLDSSERFGLGGAQGVRAYPLGEGMGDEGWLGQVELRYDAGAFAPYAFYDAAQADINYRPWNAAADQGRFISGAGFGVRTTYQQWSGDIAVAWAMKGGDAQADAKQRAARVWFSVNRSF
ncbi:MAG: ShlB/FhaC/HecB family hemolysin secretion/activation protein [Verrucomicrobia bacterium]|nr:ShlB/FhaC/HecB family hemolysin secretion/activation protein [Verrucomicrobiota bacterium]